MKPPAPRQAVLQLKAYVPPLEGRREHSRLDFNENTQGFPDVFPEEDITQLVTYPEYGDALREIASAFELKVENLLLTNGSDEGLFVASFTFIEPDKDKALVSTPNFALIPHYLKLCQAQIVEIKVQSDLTLDIESLEQELQAGVKMAVFASPENPTGQVLELPQLENWLQTYPDTIFLIDEAYNAYHGESALPLLKSYPNLIVSRTFSKAWGLAGLRLGFLAAHPQVVEWMARVRSPYSVNAAAIRAILKLLPHKDEVLRQAKDVMTRKKSTIESVRQLGYRVSEGKANFFLIWMGPTAPYFVDYCRSKGILIRDRSRLYAMEGSVRVSTGSEEEMKSFLRVLEDFRTDFALIFDLDDTLIDTSESFDRVVLDLVENMSDRASTIEELLELRAQGGFNDDWDSTVELLRRRGVTATYEEIASKALPRYLEIASEAEKPLLDMAILEKLRARHELYIVTGRVRDEYEQVWGERLNPLFGEVVCTGDNPELKPKPAPDLITDLIQRKGIQAAIYFGNSVDDMKAAKSSGCLAVGIGTNQSLTTLKEAGGDILLEKSTDLESLWLLDKPE